MIQGLHEFATRQINPIEGPWNPNQGSVPTGTRRLAPQFQRSLGDPNILGGIGLTTSDNKSKYDELILHLEHRTSNGDRPGQLHARLCACVRRHHLGWRRRAQTPGSWQRISG
jgi:hypothetical protein